MSTLQPATSRIGADHSSSALFPLAIGLFVGLDYFDNASFSFFASYIAGGVNASPDELVWSTSAYAIASVLGILQQQWWIERLGHRRYLIGCLLLFAAAGASAGFSESSLQLVLSRGLQGYFMGPMLSACRILIQVSFTPSDRSKVTRTFLTFILLASAVAPLVGGVHGRACRLASAIRVYLGNSAGSFSHRRHRDS